MIGKQIQNYCCEDICNIENYEYAVNDNTQIWDCHHRLEIELCLSQKQMKEHGLFYNRPASELIFLTRNAHNTIHHKDKKHSKQSKNKMSESHKGKKLPEETRKKISEAIKAEKHPLYGKHHTDESKKK